MIINRTIDKPIEKLNLLKDFIDKNGLKYSIEYYEDHNGNLIRHELWMPENNLCEILLISQRSLRNWLKKSNADPTKKSDDQWPFFPPIRFKYINVKLGHEVINDLSPKIRYIHLRSMLKFIEGQALMSKLMKRKPFMG